MLYPFNKFNIIQFTNKGIKSEEFDGWHNVILDGISGSMFYLVQLGKCGAINEEDTTTMGYCVIKYLSEPYTLQEDQNKYGKVIR